MRIRRATQAECIAFARLPFVCPMMAWVGETDAGLAGIGGLAWYGGRCWLWFDGRTPGVATALNTFRLARRALAIAAQLGDETVWLMRDASFVTSEKLVSMLGFVKTDEEARGMEVWSCRV